jgi:hypothetical protein
VGFEIMHGLNPKQKLGLGLFSKMIWVLDFENGRCLWIEETR